MPQTAFNEEIRKYFMLMKHDIDKGWQVQSQSGNKIMIIYKGVG